MKNVIVLAIISLFGCKKKEVKPTTPPVDTQTYCAYYYNGSVKTFYKCVTGKANADATYNEIVSGGKEAEVVAKNSCSECQ